MSGLNTDPSRPETKIPHAIRNITTNGPSSDDGRAIPIQTPSTTNLDQRPNVRKRKSKTRSKSRKIGAGIEEDRTSSEGKPPIAAVMSGEGGRSGNVEAPSTDEERDGDSGVSVQCPPRPVRDESTLPRSTMSARASPVVRLPPSPLPPTSIPPSILSARPGDKQDSTIGHDGATRKSTLELVTVDVENDERKDRDGEENEPEVEEEVIIYPSIHHSPSDRSRTSSSAGSIHHGTGGGRHAHEDPSYLQHGNAGGNGAQFDLMMMQLGGGHGDGGFDRPPRVYSPVGLMGSYPSSSPAPIIGAQSTMPLGRTSEDKGTEVPSSMDHVAPTKMLFGTIEAQVVSVPVDHKSMDRSAAMRSVGQNLAVEVEDQQMPTLSYDQLGQATDQGRSLLHPLPPPAFGPQPPFYPFHGPYTSEVQYALDQTPAAAGIADPYGYYSSARSSSLSIGASEQGYNAGQTLYDRAVYQGYVSHEYAPAFGYTPPATATHPPDMMTNGALPSFYGYPWRDPSYAFGQGYSFPMARGQQQSERLPHPAMVSETMGYRVPHQPYQPYYPASAPDHAQGHGFHGPVPGGAARNSYQDRTVKRYRIVPEARNAEKAREEAVVTDEEAASREALSMSGGAQPGILPSDFEDKRPSSQPTPGPGSLPPRPAQSHMPYQEFLDRYAMRRDGPQDSRWPNQRLWWPEQTANPRNKSETAGTGRRGQSEYVRSFSNPGYHRYAPPPGTPIFDPATYPFHYYGPMPAMPMHSGAGPYRPAHISPPIHSDLPGPNLRRQSSSGSINSKRNPSIGGAGAQRHRNGSWPDSVRRSSSVSSLGSHGDGTRQPRWYSTFPRNAELASDKMKAFWADKAADLSLEDLAGHLSEFARDQEGSRLLLRLIRTASPEAQAKLCGEVLKDWTMLADIRSYANVILWILDSNCEDAKVSLRADIKAHAMMLLRTVDGTRILEKAILTKTADCATYQFAITSQITPHLFSWIMTPGSTNAIQRLLGIIPPEQLDFLKAIPDVASQLLHNGHGCNFLVRLIRELPRSWWCPIVPKIIDRSGKLVLDAAGNYVLQALLECGSDQDRAMVIASFSTTVLFLSCHRYGSHVIEKALERGSEEGRCAIIVELLSPDGRAFSSVRRLLRDTLGNYALQAALKVVPEHLRATLRAETQQALHEVCEQFVRADQHPHASVLAVQAVLAATERTNSYDHRRRDLDQPPTPPRSAAPDNDSARPARRTLSSEDLIDLASSASSSVPNSPTRVPIKVQLPMSKTGRKGSRDERKIILSPVDEDDELDSPFALIKGARNELRETF